MLGVTIALTLRATCFSIAVAACIATPAGQEKSTAVNIAGKWVMTLETDSFTATPALELKQDGEKITGTYTGRYGSFPLEGKLKGRALAFAFTMTADGTPVAMSFTGEVAADSQTMKGRASLEGLGDATWTAVRPK